MKRTRKTEYEKGYQSGLLYDGSYLYKENDKKAIYAVIDKTLPELVKSYWEGYLEARHALDSNIP